MGHPSIQGEELVVAEPGTAVKQARVVGRAVDQRVLAVVVPEDVGMIRHDESTHLTLVIGVDQLANRIDDAIVEAEVDGRRHRATLAADHQPRR